MNDIDLYTKYSITNKYWNLSSKQTNVHYVNIGELIKKLYAIQKLGSNVGNVGLPPYGNSKLLPFDVEFECAKLDDKIRNYYYRTIIPKGLFTNYDYKYLDSMHIPGNQTSVMAQDLEKSEIGDRMVQDTKQGKVIDYGKSLPAMMAALAMLNKRLNKIEGNED